MTDQRLKYIGYSIVFQEVPNEVTLAFNISGCTHHCEGCHSEYLWKYDGNYLTDDLKHVVDEYRDYITCVCFMGGDQNQLELYELICYVGSLNLKTALYTGCDDMCDISDDILRHLDYIKLGHYDAKLGPLNSSTTNQRMYALNDDSIDNITSVFQSRGKYNYAINHYELKDILDDNKNK